MNGKRVAVGLLLGLGAAGLGSLPAQVPDAARAEAVAPPSCGLGVNLPLVGRLIGAGQTLYTSAVDVSNNTTSDTRVDFYLDGADLTTGVPISVSGSISSAGALVPVGVGGLVRSRFNAHFDDFIDALVQAGLLPATIEPDGFIGSALFVFQGFDRSGQGGAFVRFYSPFQGGTIGQALRGHEISSNEPRSLVAAFRDSRGKSGPQLYANMFVNNIGLTPAGQLASGAINVHFQAYANSSGQPVGSPLDLSIGAGQVATISDVLHQLAAPAGEDTILVYATATSGTAAIAGVAVEIDNTTRDGSVVDMNRADF